VRERDAGSLSGECWRGRVRWMRRQFHGQTQRERRRGCDARVVVVAAAAAAAATAATVLR